jgi:hypothetical protein
MSTASPKICSGHSFYSLCLQLPDADVYLDDLYSKSKEGLIDPRIEDIEEALKHLVDDCISSYIVVDAVNECQDTELLLMTLEKMIEWTSLGRDARKNLRLLVITTPNEYLETQLDDKGLGANYIELKSENIDKDITNFVKARLAADPSLKTLPELQKAEIRKELTENSKGMYGPSLASPNSVFYWTLFC